MKLHMTDQALRWLAGALLALLAAAALAAAGEHRGFPTAQAAVDAFIAALGADDTAQLGALLGPQSEDILDSGDAVADANARAGFLELYRAKHSLVEESPGTMTLQVGDEDWPSPVPVVEREGQWYLDGAAGADEVVFRRVGRNELGAIAVARGFIDAEIEYAAQARDGNDGPGVFAAKLRSDEGRQDGLYWPTAEGEPPSPAGEAVAHAAEEGYRAMTGKRTPYHGYYYRILFAQGPAAAGGAKEYFEDGLLTGGVALLAWPAEYGVSGVKSFLVNQDGVVYEKDLGEDTAATAEKIQTFDPDPSWVVVEAGDDAG